MSISDEEERLLLLAPSCKRKRKRWWMHKNNEKRASAFFTRFLYSGWPVSYKNTYSRTFSINFSVNSSAIPYCLPGRCLQNTNVRCPPRQPAFCLTGMMQSYIIRFERLLTVGTDCCPPRQHAFCVAEPLNVKNSWVGSDCGRLCNVCLFSSVDLQAQERLNLYGQCICVVLWPTPILYTVQLIRYPSQLRWFYVCVPQGVWRILRWFLT